jgi:phosphatidylserine/phosphatidylglycerophosphate/cardiolipin synthase-like enzyme
VNAPGDTVDVWPSYSPRGFVPDSTRWDLDALLRRIDGAREEIVAQFLSYGLGHGADRDSTLDQALRRAAARGVRVRLLASDWMAGRSAMADLEALAARPNVEVRLSVVPEWSGGYIPFARVEHVKAMVVDSLWTWIGTSNWEPSYFTGSRNIAVTLRNRKLALTTRRIFETSWTAPTALPVRAGVAHPPRIHGSEPPPGKTRYGE